MKYEVKDFVDSVMNQYNIKEASDLCDRSDKMYSKIYRQLFGTDRNKYPITLDVVQFVLSKFPDVSAEFLVRGEGTLDRKTNIVTTHKQEIHVDGGRAAISQSGIARVEPDEPLGNASLTDLLNEKDEIIRQLQHDMDVLKEAIRVLSSK